MDTVHCPLDSLDFLLQQGVKEDKIRLVNASQSMRPTIALERNAQVKQGNKSNMNPS